MVKVCVVKITFVNDAVFCSMFSKLFLLSVENAYVLVCNFACDTVLSL